MKKEDLASVYGDPGMLENVVGDPLIGGFEVGLTNVEMARRPFPLPSGHGPFVFRLGPTEGGYY